jgi:hypothetical protein
MGRFSSQKQTLKTFAISLAASTLIGVSMVSAQVYAHEAGGGCYRYGNLWIGTVNHTYDFKYAFNPAGPDKHAHKDAIYHAPHKFQGYKTINCPDNGRCPLH